MAGLRRVGGRLEEHRRPAGRRVLLPAEAELCNAVGLTEEEYWNFLALADAYTGERAEGYELIPDVRNDPVTLAINLVIGVALSALSALLAPKPKQQQQKERPQLKTEDIQGRSRFAPQTGFDSLQDLAALGSIVPLVFARRENSIGGVRVTSQLLWSQLLSLGTGQRLKAMMLFSSGEVEQRPDFAGYAIGDMLLESYTKAKLALYFKTGALSQNRIVQSDAYPEGTLAAAPSNDVFSVFWDRTGTYEPYFSGARTPSTQTQFGVFSPMPNGMRYKVNYELVLVIDGSGKGSKEDSRRKRSKIGHSWPYLAAITAGDGNLIKDVSTATYTLSDASDNGRGYKPWGTQDVRQAVESARIDADETLSVGESYMAGNAIVVCTGASTDDLWEIGKEKTYSFRCTESGVSQAALVTDKAAPYENLALQRCAVATVTNTRSCDATEIGIKSTVWKQISGFPNVNSYPGESVVENYEEDGGQLTLGGMSKYIKRLSFFELEVRPAGSTATWQNISGGMIFCVQGQTTQTQYNYIRVDHLRGQFEYRLKPYPGNLAYRNFKNKDIWLLHSGKRLRYNAGAYSVAFSGIRSRLTANMMSNPEWILGNVDVANDGSVRSVSPSQSGTLPTSLEWVLKQTRYRYDLNNGMDDGIIRSEDADNDYVYYEYYWGGSSSIGTREWNGPALPPPYTDRNTQYRPGALRAGNSSYGYARYEIELYEKEPVTQPPTYNDIVSATGGSGSGLTFRVKKYSNGSAIWEIVDDGKGYLTGEQVYIPEANVTVTITTDDQDYLRNNLNPYDAVSDYFLYEAERTSHMDGPEHEVVYVNEQIENDALIRYDQLAYAGLRLNSSTEWSSFSNLSAYFKRGVKLERLTTTGTSASNLLPEITYGLLTNELWGAGKLVGKDQVDRGRMTEAARFCQANGFFWDGVLDDRQNLREWIFTQAGYCLLDFTIVGGRFSLVPSVPYKSDYTINNGAKPAIKALFTDGNMRNMSVTWLGPEERQLFKAVCLWREEEENGFPQTRVLSMRFANSAGGSDGDPEETFDMSGFCTTKAHAETFAMYALKVRKEVDHSIKFDTTPQAAMNLAPGEYFRVVSEVTHTDRFECGSIDPEGYVTSARPQVGSYAILYWKPGTTAVHETNLIVSNGKTIQTELYGCVFAVKNTTTVNRVYKVETLSYADDGLVEIAASYAPLTSSGSLEILNWNQDQFVGESS